MRKLIVRLVVMLLVVGAVLGGLFYFKMFQVRMMEKALSGPQPPATVAATRAQTTKRRTTLSSVGALTAVREVAVSPEMGGTVEKITFNSGDRVEKGEALVRLDAGVERAALEALKSERELARLTFNRRKELLPTDAVSQADFDKAAAEYRAARARVTEQEAVIQQKTIRAPFEGVLGIREVDPGAYVEPGRKLVHLRALAPIYVDYDLPERHYGRVKPGQTVKVTVKALPDETFKGNVKAVDTAIQEDTRTLQVRARLPNKAKRLRPGMFASVKTIVGEPRGVVTVPRTAVSYNPYGDYVYVLEKNDAGELIANRRQIETGAAGDGRVAVTDGLEAGERVVRAGQNKLRPGRRVKVDNSVTLDDAGKVTSGAD